MGNIYQKIKKASPLKDNHDWKSTDEEVFDSAGERLMNAEKRITGGSDAVMGYSGGNSLGRELTDAEKLWKDNEIKRLGGLQQYRDHYSIGKKDVVVKDKVLGKTEYRGDQGDQDGTPGKPEQRQYNAGFYEAFSARLAAKQENKMAKQKEKRDNKSIRRYEEGSRGFLGIGKGKGKGELNERVVSGYESRGKRNDNFNYDADGNITGERGTLEGQIGKQGMSNEFSDQVVTKQMRDRANTLSMNKTGQALGDTIIIDGTPDKEGKKGKKKVAGSVAKKVTGKSLMKQSMLGGAGNIAGNAMQYNQDQGDSPLSKLRNSKRGPGY